MLSTHSPVPNHFFLKKSDNAVLKVFAQVGDLELSLCLPGEHPHRVGGVGLPS